MALIPAGFWQPRFWVSRFWHSTFWPAFGTVTTTWRDVEEFQVNIDQVREFTVDI